MTLITDATSTLNRLTFLGDAIAGVEEAKAIESLKEELDPLATLINALAIKAVTLRDEGVSISAIPDLVKVKDSVQKTLERFRESPQSSTLRRGKVWPSFTDRLKMIINNAQEIQTTDWRYYFDHHLFSGLPPSKRQEILANTPQNDQALKRYRELYQMFINYRLQPPKNSDEFKKLHQLSQQLTDISFQEDVPDGVRMFLEALSGGAGLHLLTPEVFTWLRDNGLLANYIVRARNN